MRWTAVVAEIESPPIDSSAYLAERINQEVKNIDLKATTEEQFYSALKDRLMRDDKIKCVFVIRGIYAPSADTAEKIAYEIFHLKYPEHRPTIGCVVLPSFYQIIDPVKGEGDEWGVLAALGGVVLATLGLAYCKALARQG